jgi:hypothetical protein
MRLFILSCIFYVPAVILEETIYRNIWFVFNISPTKFHEDILYDIETTCTVCQKACLKCKECDTFSVTFKKKQIFKVLLKHNEKKLQKLFSLKSSIFELYFLVCFDT